MLVDIFNSFEPVRFLIDSPLWVSFFAPGVGFALIIGAVSILNALTITDKETRSGINIGLVIILVILGGFWGLATLTEVFKRAGVAEGYPLTLAVIVGAFSNIAVLLLITYGAFTLGRFVTAHSGHQKPVKNSGEDM
jgi:hypothetical protein